jgi:hypothetical protein
MLKILYIDDKAAEAKTYGRALSQALANEKVELDVLCPPYEDMDQFLPILDDSSVVSIIIDQKLQDKVTYSGIQLATFLRGVNPKLPIYILTNYGMLEDEFTGYEWSVEAIIQKDKLIAQPEIYSARILRRLDVFGDVLAERERRFHDLLRKSLNGEITDAETQEIKELQLARTSSLLAQELSSIKDLEEIIHLYEEQMQKLKKQ